MLYLSHGHLENAKAAKLGAEAGFAALEIIPWIPRKLNRARTSSLMASLTRNNLAFSGSTYFPPEDNLGDKPSRVVSK